MRGRILLIGAEDEENLAIRYLGATLVQKGHKVKISGCSHEQDIKNVLNDFKKFKPDLVAISIAFQSLANTFFEVIKKIKQLNPQVHITVGGHFPTFEYKRILQDKKEIDSVIRFEGEESIVQLTDAILKKKELKKVSNLVYRSNGKIKENPYVNRFPDLDKLLFPLRRKRPHVRLGEKFATISASRGCFHSSCLYCCIGAFHSEKKGKKYALRSPENIAQEISELYHKYQVRLFQFHDDNFLLPSKEETIKRIQKLKHALYKEDVDLNDISFLIKARPESIDTEVADILESLGVIGVFLGVENACNSGLKALIRGNKIEDINNALKILKNYNMAITFNLLIFHPEATLEEFNANIYFIKNNLEQPFDFGRAEIVAGSPLEKKVNKEKLLKGEWPDWDYKIKDENMQKLFLIYKNTFMKKGSHYPELAHSLIALSYHVYLLNRIYPGPSAERLLQEYNRIILKSNKFILQKILEMYQLAAETNSEKALNDLYDSIRAGSSNLLKEVRDLSAKMCQLQTLEKTFSKFNINYSVQKVKPLAQILRL